VKLENVIKELKTDVDILECLKAVSFKFLPILK